MKTTPRVLASLAALVMALRAALQASIDDGSYAGLLNEYGTPLSAVKEATINGGK